MPKQKGKSCPDWVRDLPCGVYTMRELIEITGLTATSIKDQLIKYGVIIQRKESSYRNLIINIYYWDGYKGDNK